MPNRIARIGLAALAAFLLAAAPDGPAPIPGKGADATEPAAGGEPAWSLAARDPVELERRIRALAKESGLDGERAWAWAAAAAAIRDRGAGGRCEAGEDIAISIRPAAWLKAHREDLRAGHLPAPLGTLLPAESEASVAGALLGIPKSAAKAAQEIRVSAAFEPSGLLIRLAARPSGSISLPFGTPTGEPSAARALPPDADLYASARLPEEALALAAIASSFLARPAESADPLQRMLAASSGEAAFAFSIGKGGLSGTLAAGARDEAGMRKLLNDLAEAPAGALQEALAAGGLGARIETEKSVRKIGGVDVGCRTHRLRVFGTGAPPDLEIPGLGGLASPSFLQAAAYLLSDHLVGPALKTERAYAGGCAVATMGADATDRMNAALDRLAKTAGPPDPLAAAGTRHGADANLLVAIPLERAFRDLSGLALRVAGPLPLAGGAAEEMLPREGEFEGEGEPLTAAARIGLAGLRLEIFVPAKPVARIANFLAERRKRLLEKIEKSGLPEGKGPGAEKP
ncbi:MAG: hypothetical protein AAB215_07345 [Planctomycetota bacterium]